MAGHRRSKNGVAPLAYVAGIHVLRRAARTRRGWRGRHPPGPSFMPKPCLVFLLAMLVASPTRAQAPLPRVAKADQVALLADMLHAIKTSVVQRHRGQEVAIYKAVSLRLAQCAAAYSTLARDASTDAATRA